MNEKEETSYMTEAYVTTAVKVADLYGVDKGCANMKTINKSKYTV